MSRPGPGRLPAFSDRQFDENDPELPTRITDLRLISSNVGERHRDVRDGMWEEPDTVGSTLGKVSCQSGDRQRSGTLISWKEAWGIAVHQRSAVQLNVGIPVAGVSAGAADDTTRFRRLA